MKSYELQQFANAEHPSSQKKKEKLKFNGIRL